MFDKMFKAYDVRATYPEPLNEDAAWKIGCAAGRFFRHEHDNQPGTVLVSRDMRPHSESLAAALIDGIRAAGMDVVNIGMCDTSFMYFAINHLNAVGGIQTTASHNPINYNGFKMSGKLAKPIGGDTGLKQIQQIAESIDGTRPQPSGKLVEMDLWEEYRQHIHQFLMPLKRPLTMFCDASNGMAGRLMPQVFDGVDNLTIIPLNYEIGKGFAHEPNPLVAENMIPTQQGVKKHEADLGACFDGDADRCMLTDEQGRIIGCDHLTGWLAGHFLQQHPGSAIVYDLRASKVVEQTIRQAGGRPMRCRVGHVFLKGALRDNDAPFGGELSGHFYFRDNYFADSGAITLAVVLSLLGDSDRTLSELIEPYRKYPQSGEMNFRVEDKAGMLQRMKETFGKGAAVDELDGVTIDAFEQQGWWFNVRASNTEPLLRLNAEANDTATLDDLMGKLQPMLGEPVAGH